MAGVPDSVRHLVIGAGVHGLSTAWFLAQAGEEVLVLDKSGVGAGASGIACGVIRNNYFQPAMQELMAACVEIWESDPETLHYHGSGYIALGPRAQEAELAEVFERQQRIGYPSELHLGETAVRGHMRELYGDWRATGLTACLHEHAGGFAFNRESMHGLADKARAAGAKIAEGVEVTGFAFDGSGAVNAVKTSAGPIAFEQVVIAVGPWIAGVWKMLGLPDRIDVHRPDGGVDRDVPMWTYWYLEEGTLGVDPKYGLTDDGRMPPVIHVDTDAPLHDDRGSLVTEQLWGIYYKPDFNFGGVQGGTTPYVVERPAGEVAVDPYGPASPDFVVGAEFAHMWTAALAHCHKRFEGKGHLFSKEPSGGIGCFTPDSFPVFDRFRENAYVIADSNHGYKMIGVGKLVADDLLGEPSALLKPFRFSRYAAGKLHPVSNSPFPWS